MHEKMKHDLETLKCTFKPKLNDNEYTERAEAKYLRPVTPQTSKAFKKHLPTQTRKDLQDDKECSFSPRINAHTPTRKKVTPAGYDEKVQRMRIAI